MSYQSAVPQSAHLLSRSQGDLLNNFTDLNNVLAVDHIQPQPAVAAEEGNRGQHRQVTFFEALGALPTPPANAYPLGTAYTNTLTIGGVNFSELFFETTRSVGANIVRQLTGIEVVTPGAGGATDYGITTPWGLVLNWGTYNTLAGSIAITFAVPFVGVPVLTLGREDNVIPTTKYVSYATGSVANTGFTAVGSAAGFSGSYIAIGV